jgi:hypothetical protein
MSPSSGHGPKRTVASDRFAAYCSKFIFCGVGDNFCRSGRGWTVWETCSACAGS